MPRKRQTIVDQLRSAIAESELSQNALSELVGISHTQLSRFMRGERDLRLETAAKLATALNLELRSIQP